MKWVGNENVRCRGGLVKISTNTGKAEQILCKLTRIAKVAMNERKQIPSR
jgi:hypothetical protein